MACPEDVQTRKQRVKMNAEVADIYKRYVSDLLKPDQEAVDALTEQMKKLDAQMEAGKEKIEEIKARRIDDRDPWEVASKNHELSLLDLVVWSLMTGWLRLFQVREAVEERIRDLEWGRSQVIRAFRAEIEYARLLERKPGSPRISQP